MMTRSLLSILGCAVLAAPGVFADEYRLSGPYTHDNLSIFLIHSAAKKPGAKYITLQEAMDQKKVIVYETSSVNQLAIENLSDTDIYIQSGDIVKGGKQDRVFPDDFILPTKSGKVPISSFCVEHGRWMRRGSEAADRFHASNEALPIKALKMAARDEHSQASVWDEVARAQHKFAAALGSGVMASPSPTSMQLALENSQVTAAVDAYLRDLSKIPDGKPDVVGYTFAINGKVNSADMYASNDLFRRMWPKLLRASAAEALTERNSASAQAPVDPARVRDFLRQAGVGHESARGVAERARVLRTDSDKAVLFETQDNKQPGWVHRSYVAK